MKLTVLTGTKNIRQSMINPPTAQSKVYLVNFLKFFIVKFNIENINPKNKKSNAHATKKIIGMIGIPDNAYQGYGERMLALTIGKNMKKMDNIDSMIFFIFYHLSRTYV